MFSDQLANLIKKFKETSHVDVSKGDKKLFLVEKGIRGEVLPWLMKLKHGALTNVTFSLDGKDDSDVLTTFRLLTAQEDADILQEMLDMCKTKGWNPNFPIYRIYEAAKKLAKANTSIADQGGNSITLTEADFLNVMPTEMLISLAIKYSNFVLKHSPEKEDFNKDTFNEVMTMLDECEHDLGKIRIILAGLSFPLMLEMVVELYLQRRDLSTQLDSCFTGK